MTPSPSGRLTEDHRPMRRAAALLAALALLLTIVPAAALAAPSETGTWIVTLRDGVDSSSTAPVLARQHGGRIGFVYEHAINGFSFRGSQAAATALLLNPQVIAVEADAEVWLDATQSPATWGLDRIDQRNQLLDNSYAYAVDGTGVTAYVIDSGIHFSHNEFDGRAVPGADFVGDGQNGNDCNGHGSHVAGTIGGQTYGVAKDVTLVSVRVFGCTGGSTWETIIAGIDWVIQHHAGGPAVANMSLGGDANSSIDTATNNLINDGVATAIAAGNGDFLGRQRDACTYSPARVPSAMTISATKSDDAKVSWANYGSCVDWFAPGVSITSAWYTSNTATNTISGTSMATPHTAGVAALYLEANPGAGPAQVRDAIFAATTKDIVTSSSTANNDLLYMGFLNDGGDPPPGENAPPVATDDTDETGAGTAVSVDVLANDSDADGDALSVASATNGANGATVVNPDNTVTYLPAAGFSGSDTFSYAVTDGQASDTGTVTITVNAAPPPDGTFSLTLSSATSSQGSNWTAIATVSATDASGNPVSGVTISGSWSNGGTASCTTGSGGSCSVSRSQHKRVGSVTFTVTGATHSGGLTSDGGPDSITVSKP
jgi:subtilisin family serine protease